MENTTTSTYSQSPQVQPGIWPVGAKGGLYTGLVLIIFSLIGFLFEFSRDSIGGTIFNVICFCIGIYLTHKAFKDQGNGFMSYGQGLGLGSVVGLVSGFLNALFMLIYVSLIDDTFVSRQLDLMRVRLENQGLSDADIDQAISYSEIMFSPLALFFVAILGSIFYAFIIALIISAFTKNTDPEFEF